MTTFSFAPLTAPIVPRELEDELALMSYLGTSKAEFDYIVKYNNSMYSTFSIPKRGGGQRFIQSPNDRLKFIQRRLLEAFDQMYRSRAPVHGFTKDKSVISNAKSHLRKKYVLNVDLEKFFPSISLNRVAGLFEAMGIEQKIAYNLAAICCKGGHLPQGAPTSPIISNMICFRLDRNLMNFAKENRSIYTRYADDITFSSFQPMHGFFSGTPAAGHLKESDLSIELRAIFGRNGFRLNEKKIYFADKHSRKIVTGVKVNEILNFDRRYIRNLRAIIRSIEINGLECAQSSFSALGNKGHILNHIRGRLEWLSNVKGRSDPIVRSLAIRFNAITDGPMIDLAPTREELLARAVWVTEGCKKQGTLFFVNGIGLITAAHCVTGKKSVKIFHPTKHSNTFDATVEKICDHRDIAILSHNVPISDYYELEVSHKVPKKGNPVKSLGYPSWNYGDPLNERPGTISVITKISAVKMIEVSNKLGKGMSGGPVIDEDGYVIGIIHKGGMDTDRDFAVHIEELIAFAQQD